MSHPTCSCRTRRSNGLMYFWSIHRLKSKLAARSLTAREELPYVLVFFTLLAVSANSSALFTQPSAPNLWDHLSASWSIVLGVAGTIYVYRQNGGPNGQYFLQRYLVIGWVVTVRWLAWVMPAGIFCYSMQGDLEIEQANWHEFLFFGTCEVFLYWRTGHHIADLHQTPSVPLHPAPIGET
jgi:hypothetical protein